MMEDETMEQTFKEIVARYCETKPEDMDPEKRFREDLGFSSLDFMSLLGELEDTFDCLLYTSPSPRDAHETRNPS